MSRVPAHIESGSYPAQFQGWVTMPDKPRNLLCVEDTTGAVRVGAHRFIGELPAGDRVEITGLVASRRRGSLRQVVSGTAAAGIAPIDSGPRRVSRMSPRAAPAFHLVELQAVMRSVGQDQIGPGHSQAGRRRTGHHRAREPIPIPGGWNRWWEGASGCGVWATLIGELYYGLLGRAQFWILSGAKDIALVGAARPAREMPIESAAAVAGPSGQGIAGEADPTCMERYAPIPSTPACGLAILPDRCGWNWRPASRRGRRWQSTCSAMPVQTTGLCTWRMPWLPRRLQPDSELARTGY